MEFDFFELFQRAGSQITLTAAAGNTIVQRGGSAIENDGYITIYAKGYIKLTVF